MMERKSLSCYLHTGYDIKFIKGMLAAFETAVQLDEPMHCVHLIDNHNTHLKCNSVCDNKIKKDPLTDRDLKVLNNYKDGKTLSGFENVHDNLCELGYLDGDLELTTKGWKYIKKLRDEKN